MCTSASSAATNEFTALGEQITTSLQNDDIVEFSQCWISHREFLGMAHAIRPPLPKPMLDELSKMKPYLQKRNLAVAACFKALQDSLEKIGDPKNLRLVSIESKAQERHGMRKTSMFYLEWKLGESKITMDIDDGFAIADTWYFSDTPMNLQINDKFIEIKP